MFCQAIGASLLSLTVLRWLGFLGLPPVFYLLLLLVGMPLGGLLATRRGTIRGWGFSTWCLVTAVVAIGCAVTFIGLAQCLAGEIAFPGPDVGFALGLLFLRSAVVALALLPLFVVFGALEFAAYRTVVATRADLLARAYAVNLLGLLGGYVLFRAFLPQLGTTAFGLCGVAALCAAAASLLAARRRLVAVAAGLVGAALLVPLEPITFAWLETKSGPSTLRYWSKAPHRLVYDNWGRYCRLSIVDTGWGVVGLYDGMTYWLYRRNMPAPQDNRAAYHDLDIAFAKLVQRGDRVAVLGAGGGVQVAAALRAGAARVVAVEVVPEVLELLSTNLSKHVEGVYRDARVELVPTNARRYLARTAERFDVIVLASVESHLSGLRSLFEPAQVMFTEEALAQMAEHLAPGGVLAISKFTAVDRKGVVFAQCFRQLDRLGLQVTGFVKRTGRAEQPASSTDLLANSSHYLITAHRKGDVESALRSPTRLDTDGIERIDRTPEAPTRLAITDDRAFATGMLINSIGLSRVAAALVSFALLLAALGLVLARHSGRWVDAAPAATSWSRLAVAATLVGANFMLVEYLVIYRLLDKLDVPMDATMIGIAAFAGLAAVGALLTTRVPESIRRWGPVAAALLLAVSIVDGRLSLSASFVAAAATGWLFPRLLDVAQTRLPCVYIWDAYGAMWGGVIALLVPLFLGFRGFQVAAAITLLGAACVVNHTAQRPRQLLWRRAA